MATVDDNPEGVTKDILAYKTNIYGR